MVHDAYFSDIEVYEFKNGMIDFTKSAVPYPQSQFSDLSPLFLVDENFCSI